jgi:hypothetical protein
MHNNVVNLLGRSESRFHLVSLSRRSLAKADGDNALIGQRLGFRARLAVGSRNNLFDKGNSR